MIIGITTSLKLKLPLVDPTATEIAILYATKPTISSRATTCNNVSTKSPFAPVCLIVITVEAGAVAAARAARTIENAKFNLKIQNITMNITTEAISDSNKVITTTFPPFFFKTASLKNSPVLKAIKARAISDKKSIPSIIFVGIRFKTYGPIKIPATI